MEILDIVDENGNPTGQTVPREQAHREGIRHRTSHVWILRKKYGVWQILLQKRSHNKDSFPDCYDISSAGHIPAGTDFKESAVRELGEELGITAEEDQLIFCGLRRFESKNFFHGAIFHDNQVTKVFCMYLDMEPEQFRLQEEEVSEVRWFDFEACVTAVIENSIPNAIFPEELEMVRGAIVSMEAGSHTGG